MEEIGSVGLPATTSRLVAAASLRRAGAWPSGAVLPKPSPNFGYDGERRRVRLIVWHIADGTLEGTLSWLTSTRSRASSNDLIDREGRIWQLVPTEKSPWTNGQRCAPNNANPIIRQSAEQGINPNTWSHTIECAGYSTHGKAGALTDKQAATLIIRTAEMCVRHKLLADRTHIIGHNQIDDCSRSYCPGFAPEEWAAWIDGVDWLARSWRGW